MKKLFILLLLVSCSNEVEEPKVYVELEEFLELKNKVDSLRDDTSTVKMLANSLGRQVLLFNLPDCQFMETGEPFVYWVTRKCKMITKLRPDLKDATSVTVKVYKSEHHSGWIWKFENINY